MAKRLRLQGGVFAIWTGETDTLPFSAPANNLSRVKFHSGLVYPRIVSSHTKTITLPSLVNNSVYTASYFVASHGRAPIPQIFGRIFVKGQQTAFTGSVCVAQSTSLGYGRFLALGADANSIWVHEYTTAEGSNATDAENYPAISVSLTAYVTDRKL